MIYHNVTAIQYTNNFLVSPVINEIFPGIFLVSKTDLHNKFECLQRFLENCAKNSTMKL